MADPFSLFSAASVLSSELCERVVENSKEFDINNLWLTHFLSSLRPLWSLQISSELCERVVENSQEFDINNLWLTHFLSPLCL